MRSPLDALVTERTLRAMANSRNADLMEMVATDPALSEAIPTKNVCVKVLPYISDEIDEIVGLLGCQKRAFLEAALLEAISRAHKIIRDEGFHEQRKQIDEDVAEYSKQQHFHESRTA